MSDPEYISYNEKIKIIYKNGLTMTAWEVVFLNQIEWMEDDNLFSKKQKAVIDSIFYREK